MFKLDNAISVYGHKNLVFKFKRQHPQTKETIWAKHKLVFCPSEKDNKFLFRCIDRFILPTIGIPQETFNVLTSAGDIHVLAKTLDGEDVVYCVIDKVYCVDDNKNNFKITNLYNRLFG